LHDIDRAAQKLFTGTNIDRQVLQRECHGQRGCAARFCAMTAPDLDRLARTSVAGY